MGVTRLRLARFGCRNRPFYRLVAIDSRKFREAAPLEYVRRRRRRRRRRRACTAALAPPSAALAYASPPYTSPPPPPPRVVSFSLKPQLGTYDPLPYSLDETKEVRLKVDRIKYWLSVGAQPSERVSYLLWRSGVVPAPPVRFSPSKAMSKDKLKALGGKAAMHTMSEARLRLLQAQAAPPQLR
jgi:small subunit ribosomal protein S16